MRIYHVRVNHLEDPLGFYMERVVFSWKVAEAAGKQQESARVVVAADAAMEQVLLDTGFDPQANSLAWELPLPLSPRTRYFYTVAVRTDAGEEAVSPVCWFETAKREEPWQAVWITCSNAEPRHPIFERDIAPEKPLRSARLYICGLGLYEAFYNGARIGSEQFTPYCNAYDQWVQYQTFDVTQALRQPGTLSVLLGNGWYKGRFGFSGNFDKGFYGDEWKLLAELRLSYEDGTEQVIGTDESWRVRRSRIQFSNIYDGEWRDDTLPELPAEPALPAEAPKGTLTERMSTPVTVRETFAPVALLHTPADELVLDMGQEFTGSFRLRVDLPRGAEVRVQTGEILQNDCFYNANLRSAKSEYRYVSGGEPVVLEPHFTFYGYRYVKIEGIPDLKKEDFEGLALYSDIPERGRMTTGHALVNQLLSNVRWGLKSNFLDVPTDCPQRDERMGWTGDAQVFSPTALYLQDTCAFYTKYLYDVNQEQRARGGMVPDVVPAFDVGDTACVWGDVACIIPWNLYRYYGDIGLLRDQFPGMKAWVDYVRRVDGDDHGWRHVFHFGDWLALDNMNGDPEQVLGATDEEFIANLYYAISAELVAKAAHVLGDAEAEREYGELARTQYDVVRREYFSPTGRCCIKTQTALILALKYDLTSNRALTIQQLQKLFRDSDGKLRTGFVGTPLLCGVLSENGMDDLAWQLLFNEEYPGWLREIKLGATTVWERWNSLLDDGTISGISMNSMNHYAYGSIVEWLFWRAAGLVLCEDAPGCRHMDFRPALSWELRQQETSYDSPAGLYRSAWKLTDPSHVELSVTVPFGATATLVLPEATPAAYSDTENPLFAHVVDGVCQLEPGTYTVCYKTCRPLKKTYSTECTVRELRACPAIRKDFGSLLASVPKQYLDTSLRELAGVFRGRMNEEQLDGLDKALAKY